MCQMSVILDDNGGEKTIMENVTLLESTDEGVALNALFEEPVLVENCFVKKIDFTGGKVYLASSQRG